ncbi:3-hydroxyacyl-CoA dehydrogenase NAD-binding domain-containing protein [Roseobacteraceae bacterium S113]
MAVQMSMEGAVAVVTIDNPPVNAAGYDVRAGLVAAVAETEADPAVRAVVLLCAGRTFVAGADVREFGQPPKAPHLPDVVLALEGAEKPRVAAIHGTALGGGLEIALGCHARVAQEGARMGLPEVNLGIIPGAGGTVRLPRLVAPDVALEMMAGGKPVSAARALEIGLVDAVVQGDLRGAAIAQAQALADRALPTPLAMRAAAAVDPALWETECAKIAKRARGQASPVALCELVSETLALPGPEALARERAVFLELRDSDQARALRHIFFAERAAGKIAEIAELKVPAPTRIGVIGGGTMGAGIAAACLLAGRTVTMIERDGSALDQGQARVRKTLEGSAARGLITADAQADMLARFDGATDYAVLAPAELVIEAVFEDMEVKRAVFAALDAVVAPEAVLASNTSYLDIAALASGTAHPARVIGLHFFSPAHIMKLMELVIPEGADPAAIARGAALGKALGKIVVPAGVCDGFIGNRIMAAYRRDCDVMLVEGARPSQIDGAMRAFGFPMGIYEMQDLAGLDIAWAMRKRQAATRDPGALYVRLADQLCEAGRFGRKAGRGWHLYPDGKTATPDPELEPMITAEAARLGLEQRAFDDAAIMARILAVMQRVGGDILAEGIARKASDIDTVMVHGYAFPRWRGGPMFMAQPA